MREEEKIKLQMAFDINNRIKDFGILRFQALTIISTVSMAVFGLIFSFAEIIQNTMFAGISITIFLFVALASIAIYLDQTRENICYLRNILIELKTKELGQDFDTPTPKNKSNWPEYLFIAFVFGILFFTLSLL